MMESKIGPGGGLVPIHGGLAELVDRRVPLGERSRFVKEADRLPSIRVTRADLSTVYRISDGALSPMEGPMCADEWNRVLDEQCIEVAGRRYAWTIPLSLPVTSEEASLLSSGESAAVRDESGAVVGIVDELEVFDWDKTRYIEKVYRTDRFDHPGGRAVESDPRNQLLGGALRALPQPVDPNYGEYMLSPRMTRAFIRERKWDRALAFQTRNPLHRAHEYALVAGAEKLTRAGHFTGVVLNPLVAIFAFNMTLVVMHLPHVFDYQFRNESFHFSVHVWTVAVALMMWWPIITKVPGLPRLSYPYQMAYLFVQSLVPAIIGSFITFSRTAVYDFYEQAPRIWGLDPVDDQQLAAFIMKVVGSLILWGFIGFAFFRWYAEEESTGQGVPWADAKEEARRAGLNPNR